LFKNESGILTPTPSVSASFALVAAIRIDQDLAAGLNPCGLVPYGTARNSAGLHGPASFRVPRAI
jgi:hypothetical protein